MCECGSRLLDRLGGPQALRKLLVSSASTHASGRVVEQFNLLDGTRFHAVRGSGGFDSWGVVDAKGRCCTCSGNNWSCEHASLLQEPSAAAAATAAAATASAAAAWEAKVAREVDVATGIRPLKCISQQRLPEDLRDDARLLQLSTGALSAA